MRYGDHALQFLERFAAGDVDGLEPLMSEDLRLMGPFLEVDSRADYLEALRRDPPEPCGFNILSVTEESETVAVFYEYEKPDVTLAVAQLFRFEHHLISEIRIVIDTRMVG